MKTMRTIYGEMIDYYDEDESLVDAPERYYSESEVITDIDRMSTAVWVGSNAIVQKLGTYVKREDFKALSRGFLPEALKSVAGGAVQRIRGKKPNEEDKERHAHDVVLSAPKSVSMALHLEGDNRLFDAHMEAVLETFELLEREYAQTRIQVNGVRSVVDTGNMIAALMPHHTSRDGDMQLHTHMLIMNGTQGPDGQWRSLSHEKLAQAKWIGSFYRQKLAEKVQRLGYRIYQTKDAFELVGYDRSDVEVFSKRHRAIVKAVRDEGLEVTPENKKLKVLPTRKAKRGVGKKLEIIQDHWREEALSQGVSHPILAEPLAVMPDPDRARYEVESAIRHYAEWSSIFEKDDIYAYVFKTLKRQGMAMEQVDEAIKQSKELIPVERGFTTVTAVEEEAQIHQRWMAGQGQAQPMVANPSLLGISVKLNEDQAKAILNTLSSSDRYQIWQGFPGVGKSRTLGVLKTLLNGSGLNIQGFSPTIPAAKKLQDELGITTNTVEHLVLHKADDSPNQVWLIDEAGMMSRRQMKMILEKAEPIGAKVIFVGDAGQNSSIEAGNPFKFMQANGATTHRIEEIVRQKVDVQKQAVELIARGRGIAALELLDANGYVIESGDKSDMAQAAADQYLALPLKEQEETLIIAGTNEERLDTEQAIRRGEKQAGRLGESSKIVQLKSRNLSIEQKRRADWYRKGDYVRLLQTSKTASIKRGELYKVERREGDELVVSSFGGRLYRFKPAKYKLKEVYSAHKFDVAVGDKLRWTTTIKENNWINGQQLTVTTLDGLNMKVRDHEGRSHDVPLTQPLALEYDRVWTSYRSQSGNKKRTIVITTNDRTSSREPFLVDISRQEHELTVYTESLNKLRNRVAKSNAQKSALDLIEGTYGNQRTTTERQQSTTERQRNQKPTRSPHGRDHHPDQSSRRGPSPEPTHPRREQRTQVPGQGADQHHSNGSQSRSQPVHPGIQGGDGIQEALGYERIDQGTRQGNGQLKDENRGYQRLAVDDERQGIGGRRGNHADQGPAPPTRPTQDGRSVKRQASIQNGSPEYHTISSDLVGWVNTWSEEQELSASGLEDHLLALAKDIENLTQSLEPSSFSGLGELANVVKGQQGQQALAQNLTYISQSINKIDQTIDQTLRQRRIKTIADAVVEWRTGQELANAVTELVDVLAQGTEGLDRAIIRLQAGIEATQYLDVQFPAMAELVDAVQDWQTEVEVSAVMDEVQDLVASITVPQFLGMDDLAQDVHDLNEEQALAESGLVEQLADLTTQINELAKPQQVQFEGIEQLAEIVSELQQGQSLAQVQPQLQAITQQIEAFNAKQPTYSFARIKELADTVSEWRAHESITQHIGALNDLTVRAQRSLKTFPAMLQLAKSVKAMRSVDALMNGPVADQLKEVARQLTDKGMSVTPKPKTIDDQVFWKPDYTGVERPDYIDEKHWNEWVASCVHPDVIAARLQSIADDQVIDRLLGAKIEDIATRRRDGSFKTVRSQYHIEPIRALINDRSHPEVLSYQELAEGGGWWADAGVDPLTFEELGPNEEPTLSLYGTFKPDTPRIDVDKTRRARAKDPNAPTKYRKYENPLGTKRELFERDMAFQPVPDHIAERIFDKYGVVQTDEERTKGFWYTVYKHPEIPIYRTEGDKKDAALVSQGRVVIGGQGVNIGYRAKNQHDEKLERRVLHPQLDVFAVPGREFRYAHDWDSKQSTVWNVRREMVREAELIEERDCETWRIPWDSEKGKGVDDLIANHGPIAFERADKNAYPMEREITMHYRGQYTQIKKRLNRHFGCAVHDIPIYLEAMKDGDEMDGIRVLWESSTARSFQHYHDKQHYIEGIIKLSDAYRRLVRKDGDPKAMQILVNRLKKPRPIIKVEARSRNLKRGRGR
ncbi:MobF family relaxase [Acaryochloris sp. CCMEE 5410]|uniref:MobF family relaxase n=1 Tax=Acaryochloris sp. CCMEE 5410 TaxID=310037 RepID=UPI0021D00969|nr:MobF family relaxase [Acaryochloris sp. CCMEE 5410]KAI9129880.1 relaxase domain-containing protein [Acaryochloris sp. CCMEE 5410]